MARYKLTISGVFDSDNFSNTSDKLILHLVRNCCPDGFGFDGDDEQCNMSSCVKCWENALEAGVNACVKSVHVERLD